MDVVALAEQELGEVGAILPGDPCDQRNLAARSRGGIVGRRHILFIDTEGGKVSSTRNLCCF